MHDDQPILDETPLGVLAGLPGGQESVLELVEIFDEDVPSRLSLIRDYLADGRGKDACIEAHGLKGGAANMGLMRFAGLAGEMEHRLRDAPDASCADLLEALEAAFPEAMTALRGAFGN